MSAPRNTERLTPTTILTLEETSGREAQVAEIRRGSRGKGGPYRLDAGHKVHQVSQAEKDAVPEEVRKAAREMGEKAFRER
ncbi:hypothetical protein CgunFtcFv8_024211 [Champsocephalus gunnari]|uniref:Uncharacterized protein n=1 Tax=Champsocephalus gunnari TaxID=52237 RepID=A0AAN8DBE3_CHAGU|nr:hypothetical protein CgunFtcFv8_024211 [Champsocephalus gunnari]